ncbi:MAG TPA: hypothetical protein VEB21_11680 [Terriglobales bacterium]|nr:hypothetical protein [Terriglobales bacterium]
MAIRVLAVLGLLFIALPAYSEFATAPYREQCRLSRRVTESDRKAIVDLAKRMGMSEPLRICDGGEMRPGGCKVVEVTSRVTVDGPKREWLSLIVEPDQQDCVSWVDLDEQVTRVASWRTNRDRLSKNETWRVDDGAWHVDVPLDEVPGIAFADLRATVHAIRRRQWINKQPKASAGVRALVSFRPDDIRYISRSFEGEFEVKTGDRKGVFLHFRVVGNAIELHYAGRWSWPDENRD